ncbi:ADP-glyceromanno-heptose 6-epimerase [Leptospira mayottensis]|uniref:ADP-glyceromanno-heptose 6-epimerase n=2 Tax=Leptospira mayottensis TaxID=1137606 RepID=A0AA87MSK3_9LEPT|nr:ADP-glyceromanno-heptose 6-epimerase [Leptospira mayottensis]AXR61475.1 ADP-glyceromanno-heptose 6-epimerase [Leptospira mayottensis]AXR65262.1 ADP-glyceromanno-heptose 6-epimerase [Leptospira mayottensis]AXR69041.1 ADP-glyceromanno-heptose 6-epimerase [Leptospira mayottensis]AZQ02085.1 ADP-glyceromanno-heptose 6-epimerase [Leptospira mayottensis 200901116]EKS01125.1 ADP-glyceromanno-heptose 6-epimerase [Leptospira mayottensis 200901122]
MMKKRCIVTGGAGLIGSNLIEELNRQGIEDILVVDHLGTSSKWKNLIGKKYSDYLEKENFLDSSVRTSLLKDYHVLFHLGACSSTIETDASYLIKNNFEYTKLLANESLKNGIRFVYASSAATYGDGANGYDDKAPINSLKPLNMYGYSKHMFDLYAQKHGLSNKITGIKYFNVFGYGEGHKEDMRSVVLKGYEQIKKEGRIRLFKSYKSEYKDGEQKRDFLYVKDAAKITAYLAFGDYAGLYNLGRGIAETWNDLVSAIFDTLKLTANIEYIEMPESLKAKYQYYTCADTTKLLKTGYSEGFTQLKEAVREYVTLLQEEEGT